MLRSIPLQEIMTTKLVTLHPKDKMIRVKETFEDFNIHHLPIAVAGEVVGVISKSDYLLLTNMSNNSYDKFIQEKIFITHTVDEFMKKEVYCLTAVDTIGDAIDIFLKNHISCLPIVSGKKLVGIITPYDILKVIDKFK
jgi:acetoin utilization protein AcuB